MYGVTTVHDTVLCFDRTAQRVTHRLPALVDPADLVLCTGLERPDVEFGVFDRDNWRPVDIGLTGASRATAPGRLAVSMYGGLATLRSSLGLVRTPPDGTILLDGTEAAAWERLAFIERRALVDVLELCRSDWVRVGTRTLIDHNAIKLENRTSVLIGEHVYPIGDNFPLSSRRAGRQRNLLFREGWIVDEFIAFRPLVYFVLMGAGAYAEQLKLATSSLVEFGHYGGDVLVVTDRDRSLIESLLPPSLLPRLSVLNVASSGKIDAVLARLMIGEHEGITDHAPILYVDTDVVFDRPLQPTLETALLSGRMSAQSERWNELPGSDAAGGDLFKVDPIPFRDSIGFNAGIWSMPGGHDSVQIVEAIRLSVSRYLHKHGRESLPWLDQAMGNYVLRKLDAFDAHLITSTTRLCQSYETLDASDPAGFVHFWPVSAHAAERAAAMADYLERLRRAQDLDATLPDPA